MNFLQFKTPKELEKATGLTVSQALKVIDEELNQLKQKTKGA